MGWPWHCLLVSYVYEFTNKMLLSVQNLIHSHFQQCLKSWYTCHQLKQMKFNTSK